MRPVSHRWSRCGVLVVVWGIALGVYRDQGIISCLSGAVGFYRAERCLAERTEQIVVNDSAVERRGIKDEGFVRRTRSCGDNGETGSGVAIGGEGDRTRTTKTRVPSKRNAPAIER